MSNNLFTKEDNKRIGLLSQLNIEKVPVHWLEGMLIELRKYNKKKQEKK